MAAGVAPYDMDGNRIDDVLNIKGDYVNMCKGAIGIAKDAEKKGMLKGKKRAYEEISHILDGVLDGLGDDDISSKYNIDVKSVQQIRACMDR